MNSIVAIFSRGWDFVLIVLAVMLVTQIAKKPILRWVEKSKFKAVAENIAKKNGIKSWQKLLIYVVALLTAMGIYIVYWGCTKGWDVCRSGDVYIAAATAFSAAVTLYEILSRLIKGEDLTKGMDDVSKTLYAALAVVVAPLNTQLAASGKAVITPEQLKALVPVVRNNVADVNNISEADKANIQLALTNLLPAETCKTVAEFVFDTLKNSAVKTAQVRGGC